MEFIQLTLQMLDCAEKLLKFAENLASPLHDIALGIVGLFTALAILSKVSEVLNRIYRGVASLRSASSIAI